MLLYVNYEAPGLPVQIDETNTDSEIYKEAVHAIDQGIGDVFLYNELTRRFEQGYLGIPTTTGGTPVLLFQPIEEKS